MMAALLLVSAPAAADPLGVVAAVRQSCSSAGPKEIVICGSREESGRYQLPKLSDEYSRPALKAETGLIPGIHGSLQVEPVELPGGAKSNRV
jgi:hypothetical protein